MAYNTDLPPTIRRTNQTEGPDPDEWVLETNSGTEIASYTRVGMSIDVWWGDILRYILANARSVPNAIEDITLLMVQEDWDVVS